jgi:hypothetical protein
MVWRVHPFLRLALHSQAKPALSPDALRNGPVDIALPHHPVEPRTGCDAKLLLAVAQHGFKLRVAFQRAGEGFHAGFHLAARLVMLPAFQAPVFRLQPVPDFHQPLGPQIGVLPHPFLVPDARHELRRARLALEGVERAGDGGLCSTAFFKSS